MEMTTYERTVAASRQKIGVDVIEISSGQNLKIETSPQGEELLNYECPEGVSWSVQITVIINEVDN